MSTTTLHREKNKTLVPQLRFQEFDGEWTVNKLGNYCNFNQGVQVDLELQLQEPKDGYTRFIRIENYTQKSNDFRYIPNKLTNKKSIDENEIAVVRYGATAGYIGRGLKGVLANNLFKVLPNIEILNTSYLFEFLNGYKAFSFFQTEMSGGAMPALSFGIVNALTISFPTLPEQQKIASFLSAVDEKIQQLSLKKELLEQYKKGVMQQLFSGKLRFKDDNGKDYPDWEEKKLGEISTLLKDGSHGSHKDVPDSKYYLLSAKNISNGQISYNADDRKISDDDFKSIYKNYSLQENDILLTIVGTIGRVAMFKGEKNISFQRSVAFFRFKDIYANYMFQLMNGDAFQKELDTRKVVSAQPGIYLGDLAKIAVNIPSIPEQQQIANFLSGIDGKIEQVNGELVKTQEFKKGLLQQMFV